MRGHVDIGKLLGQIAFKEMGPNEPVPWSHAPKRTSEDIARDTYARVKGPPAAAWLVWKHRAALHATGAVDFDFPKDAKLPPWFLVAVRCLVLREEHWDVAEVIKPDDKRAVRVRWKHWNEYRTSTRTP
jgi:hypothetical protein